MLLMHAFLHDYKAELRAGCVKLANRQAGVASSLFLIRTDGAQWLREFDILDNNKKFAVQLLTRRELDELRADMIKSSELMKNALMAKRKEKSHYQLMAVT
ncbi:hypothetical protein ACSZM1_16550 [Aeromonas veronii]